MYNFDAVKVKNDCVQWIKNWFEENGKDCKAVIGISGGKDSTVVAALCSEALGKEKVLGVLMPNGYATKSRLEGIDVVKGLHIPYIQINISGSYDVIYRSVNNCSIIHLDDKPVAKITMSKQAEINLAPRLRMTSLYAVSQSVNGRVANTCNLSEDWIGYSTRYGDTAGDFSPLSRLTSDEVVAIGDACGLPYELTHRVPSDGLCGKTDEDNFGFSYAVLNKYIRTGICEDEAIKNKIDQMHKKNLFKLLPMPYFEY